jgi:hypothetical protein
VRTLRHLMAYMSIIKFGDNDRDELVILKYLDDIKSQTNHVIEIHGIVVFISGAFHRGGFLFA